MPWYNKVASSSAAASINQQTKLAGEFNFPRFVLATSFRRRFARRETNKRTLRASAFASELFSPNCATLGAWWVGWEGSSCTRRRSDFSLSARPMQNQHRRRAQCSFCAIARGSQTLISCHVCFLQTLARCSARANKQNQSEFNNKARSWITMKH